MDESGEHRSKQTNTRTENQTPYILIQKSELKNENTCTQGGKHHTLGTVMGWSAKRGIALGEIANVDDEVMDAANHRGPCTTMYKPAHSAHVPQNLKYIYF